MTRCEGATVGAKTTELPMRHRDPVPEIPPIPDRRAGAGTPDTRATPRRVPQQPEREQPALPDLLEAFWGDAAANVAEGAAKRSAPARKRDQRRNMAAACSTQRSKTASDV